MGRSMKKAVLQHAPPAPPSGVVGYVRVSSRSQDDASQRSAILKAAEARGDTVVAWFAEKMSGKTLKRPELDRLRADVRAGIVRRVYVFKLDRLTRSGVADTYAVIAEARRANCTVIAVADNLVVRPDSDDLTSEVLTFALSLAARIERTAINDRISAARSRVEAEGGHWGRPLRMTAEQLRRARELEAAGKSVRDIAQRVGVPRSTIHAALSRKDGPVRRSPAPRGARANPLPVPV